MGQRGDVPQIWHTFPLMYVRTPFHLFIFTLELFHLVHCASQILQDIITFGKQGSGT